MALIGKDFPVSDYYKDHIVDARTISRGGGWWMAALVISDPKSGLKMLNLYQWQLTDNGWKTRKQFSIKNKKALVVFRDLLDELLPVIFKG
ncbi:hypothetical protein ACFL0M_11400 [Thermodesulfobacteriota bacterium]